MSRCETLSFAARGGHGICFAVSNVLEKKFNPDRVISQDSSVGLVTGCRLNGREIGPILSESIRDFSYIHSIQTGFVLLALANTTILDFGPYGTREHILLSHNSGAHSASYTAPGYNSRNVKLTLISI